MRATSTQNQTLVSRRRRSASTLTNNMVASPKQTAELSVATIIAVCLRLRSTKVPKAGPRKAIERLNAAPMTPVATTERVSRYTQNVRANHTNELVTPLASVLTSRARKARSLAASVAWGVSLRESITRRYRTMSSLLLGRRTGSPLGPKSVCAHDEAEREDSSRVRRGRPPSVT